MNMPGWWVESANYIVAVVLEEAQEDEEFRAKFDEEHLQRMSDWANIDLGDPQ